MATISIDFDSSGDVELILQNRPVPAPNPGNEEETESNWEFGSLDVKFKEVRLRVSSEKLMSCSDYFRATLPTPRFREGEEFAENGSMTLNFSQPEDDAESMMIILGILYESEVQVPTRLSVQKLYNMATLVDKLQCQETVAFQAREWLKGIMEDFMNLTSENYEVGLRLLWITWVFNMKRYFVRVIWVVQLHALHQIDPIDEKILLPSYIIGECCEIPYVSTASS